MKKNTIIGLKMIATFAIFTLLIFIIVFAGTNNINKYCLTASDYEKQKIDFVILCGNK